MKHKIKSFLRIFIIISALFLSLSLLGSISKITSSNQKITDAEKRVEELKNENKELENEIKIASSSQFMEQTARDKLGLAKKGEVVVVLPSDEVLRSLAPRVHDEKIENVQPNWRVWLKLFGL